MNVLALIGEKREQGQKFLENGTRIPVTQISIPGNKVFSVKTPEKDKYSAIQVGFGLKKNAKKALLGLAKKASLSEAPYYLREITKMDGDGELPTVGDTIKASDIFKEGDIVNVIGVSKGKGYAGVVKRYHFRGGPKTHGQSDRHRAPGAIGQGTTPGRVYKGKRMAGRMGQDKVTVRNLVIVKVMEEEILIDGLVPGARGNLLMIEKVGESKKFVPLYQEATEQPITEEASAPAVDSPVVSDVQQGESPRASETEDQQTPVAPDAAIPVQEPEAQERPAADEKEAASANSKPASSEPEEVKSSDAKAKEDKEDGS